MSKAHDIAQGAAILATKFNLSPYQAASVAIKLDSLGASISALETFAGNGFKTDWHDEQFRKMAQLKDTAGVNALQTKINDEGNAYYEKRSKSLEKSWPSYPLNSTFRCHGLGLVV